MQRGARVPLRTDPVVSTEPACTSRDDGARQRRSPGTGPPRAASARAEVRRRLRFGALPTVRRRLRIR